MKGIYFAWYEFGGGPTYVKILAVSRKQAGFFFTRFLAQTIGGNPDRSPLPELIGTTYRGVLGGIYGEAARI